MNPLRIKEIRIARGMTQVELGEKLGLSQAEISRKESGLTAIEMSQMHAFANALGVTISELFWAEEHASQQCTERSAKNKRATV